MKTWSAPVVFLRLWLGTTCVVAGGLLVALVLVVFTGGSDTPDRAACKAWCEASGAEYEAARLRNGALSCTCTFHAHKLIAIEPAEEVAP